MKCTLIFTVLLLSCRSIRAAPVAPAADRAPIPIPSYIAEALGMEPALASLVLLHLHNHKSQTHTHKGPALVTDAPSSLSLPEHIVPTQPVSAAPTTSAPSPQTQNSPHVGMHPGPVIPGSSFTIEPVEAAEIQTTAPSSRGHGHFPFPTTSSRALPITPGAPWTIELEAVESQTTALAAEATSVAQLSPEAQEKEKRYIPMPSAISLPQTIPALPTEIAVPHTHPALPSVDAADIADELEGHHSDPALASVIAVAITADHGHGPFSWYRPWRHTETAVQRDEQVIPTPPPANI